MRKLSIAILISCLIGCANYEFGDATKAAWSAAGKIVQMKRDYCSAQNTEQRDILLGAIKLADPDYDGVCKEN